MRPITSAELLDLTGYERARPALLAEVIELKRSARRVAVGPELSFLFENRETVRSQIHEMLRTERIVDPERIEEELRVYNELLPHAFELSATLFIEIPDLARIRPTLDKLVGIDEHVRIEIGDAAVRATFDPKQFEQDRISAVQYIRFPIGATLAARFRDGSVPVRLVVEHPNYRHATPLQGAPRASLARDLEPGV
jgi:hypothetical protein